MMNHKRISGSRLLTAGVFLVMARTHSGSTHALEVASPLAEMARAEGTEYVKLRTALLAQRAEPWDAAAAARESWHLGLAAFILNERMANPEKFARWDNIDPRPDIRGAAYKVFYSAQSSTKEADWRTATAFLLEKMWKAPAGRDQHAWSPGPEKEKAYAFGELRIEYPKESADPELWKAMWKSAEDERFRFLALGPLCANYGPALEPLIVEFLHGEDVRVAGYRIKGRCLTGLAYSDSQRAKDLVLEAWDRLKAQGYQSSTLDVLATSSNAQARDLMYSVALDRGESDTTRQAAVAKLSILRYPGDQAFLEEFFSTVESDSLKDQVLSNIPRRFPLDMYRKPVREILGTSTNPRLVRVAAIALVNGHKAPLPLRDADTGEWDFRRRGGEFEALDIAAWDEDVSLLEEVAGREGLPPDLKAPLEQYLAGMYELRRLHRETSEEK